MSGHAIADIRIADGTPDHQAVIVSTHPGQSTPNRLVTRRTPVNYAVCCLIAEFQAAHRAKIMEAHHGR